MLWIKAFHIIAMVAWFSGLFYLPRLFIYHTQWNDDISNQHFKIMESKLYRYITTPAGILTLMLGLWLISFDLAGYMHQPWMHMKLTAVFLLGLYHLYLGRIVANFQLDKNQHSLKFYGWLHRLPTIFLVVIVCLVVVRISS